MKLLPPSLPGAALTPVQSPAKAPAATSMSPIRSAPLPAHLGASSFHRLCKTEGKGRHRRKPLPPDTPAHVRSTAFAKLAAERLIDRHGTFQASRIPELKNELQNDHALSPHHRDNALRTLEAMESNPQLLRLINETCDQQPLCRAAIPIVRGTLNLPLQTQPTTVHARRALVMALLGNLRQREVGSCFATGVAILLHEHYPEQVALQLRTLLEKGALRLQTEDAEMEAPLNGYTSYAPALIVQPVHRDANGEPLPEQWHSTPGMQAALTALNGPREQMESAVLEALRHLKDDEVTADEIFRYLAREAHSAPPSRVRLKAARDAYAGVGDVRLLRAWEYTLATASDMITSDLEDLVKAVTTGVGQGEAAHHSLVEVGNAFMNGLYQSEEPLPIAKPDLLLRRLLLNIQETMRRRLFLQYDASVRWIEDERSYFGAFVLHDRPPGRESPELTRISKATDFPAVMADIVDQTVHQNCQTLAQQAWPSETQAVKVQSIVRRLGDELAAYVRSDGFRDRLTHCFPDRHPWRQARGSAPGLVRHLFGAGTLVATLDDSEAAPVDLVRNLGLALETMSADLSLHYENTRTADFKLPFCNSVHAFSLLPWELKDIWLNGMTGTEWIETHLIGLSLEHLDRPRAIPPRAELFAALANEWNTDAQELEQIYRESMPPANGRLRGQSYTLALVQGAIWEYCARHPERTDLPPLVANDLAAHAPAPAKIIADLNWVGDDGEPVYLGISHNPFSTELEMLKMSRDGRWRERVEDDFLLGEWVLWPPPAYSE